MTVGELREALKNYNDNTVVEIYSEKYNDSTFINRIDEYEKGFVELVIDDNRWDMKEFPKDATNGDVIKAMFPNVEIIPDKYTPSVDLSVGGIMMMRVDRNWWNAKYKGVR